MTDNEKDSGADRGGNMRFKRRHRMVRNAENVRATAERFEEHMECTPAGCLSVTKSGAYLLSAIFCARSINTAKVRARCGILTGDDMLYVGYPFRVPRSVDSVQLRTPVGRMIVAGRRHSNNLAKLFSVRIRGSSASEDRPIGLGRVA